MDDGEDEDEDEDGDGDGDETLTRVVKLITGYDRRRAQAQRR